ncbi:hypothetical protein [Pandoraea sputorum]|uniref:hypothetical protein n=1 Tax=Pandoraea sputorum TaxID=93222 RepID=UPI002AF6C875|nr:hypothetical protein [Pandoraea sputorum]
MRGETLFLESWDFFPRIVIEEIRSQHNTDRSNLRLYWAEAGKLREDDLLLVAQQSKDQIERIIGKDRTEELATFLSASSVVSRTVDAKAVPTPSFIVVDRKPKSDDQRTLRRLLKRWLYCVGGLGDVQSGLADKRVKAFSWLHSTDLSIDSQRSVRCFACGSEGCLTVHSEQKMVFKCECGHWADYERDVRPSSPFDDLSSTCKCAYCLMQRERFATGLRHTLSTAEPMVLAHLREWAGAVDSENALSFEKSLPSDEDMRRDYLVERNNVGKSLRSILALNPKDGADFLGCVERMVTSSSSHRAAHSTIKKIVNDAKRRRLIYEVTTVDRFDVTDAASAFARAASLFFGGKRGGGTLRTERGTDAPNPLLVEVYEILFHRPVAELRDAIRIFDSCVTLQLGERRLLLFDDIDRYGTIFSTRLQTTTDVSYVINPYFSSGIVGRAEVATNAAPSAGALFNSVTEGRAYARIVMENSGAIVVPNRLLVQVVGRQRMKTEIAPAFDADDRTYLFNCEVDFAVYDSEGTILFVEEMQRGDHHDTAEWMRKDALKRAALGLAGIPFRESF